MNNKNVSQLISYIVIIISASVMCGWFFDIPILKSILPQWVTMKFSTALCFFMSGIILYNINVARTGHLTKAQTFLPLPCMCITLIMATLLLGVIADINTGIEDVFVKEQANAVLSAKPGQPSVGTMVAFLIIALLGYLTISHVRSLRLWLLYCGGVVAIIGGIALVGYMIQMPVLYYTFDQWSSAMAFHTALLFLMLGMGILFVSKVGGK